MKQYPAEHSSVLTGTSLGYFLTKNKLYMSISLPEYALQTTGKSLCCSPGIPNVLENYRKSSPLVKYSTNFMNRFFIGVLDYELEAKKHCCNMEDMITKVTFNATTYKNKSGWNFGTMPNDLAVEIMPQRNDTVWMWKYGFVIAQHGNCPECPCKPPIVTLHQFMINEKPYAGITTTGSPKQYIGKYPLEPGREG